MHVHTAAHNLMLTGPICWPQMLIFQAPGSSASFNPNQNFRKGCSVALLQLQGPEIAAGLGPGSSPSLRTPARQPATAHPAHSVFGLRAATGLACYGLLRCA